MIDVLAKLALRTQLLKRLNYCWTAEILYVQEKKGTNTGKDRLKQQTVVDINWNVL